MNPADDTYAVDLVAHPVQMMTAVHSIPLALGNFLRIDLGWCTHGRTWDVTEARPLRLRFQPMDLELVHQRQNRRSCDLRELNDELV